MIIWLQPKPLFDTRFQCCECSQQGHSRWSHSLVSFLPPHYPFRFSVQSSEIQSCPSSGVSDSSFHPGSGTDTSDTSPCLLFWVILDKEWKPLLDRCSQTSWTKSLPTLPVLRLDLFTLLFSVCEVKPSACGNEDTETPGIVIWRWEFLAFSRESKLNVRKL